MEQWASKRALKIIFCTSVVFFIAFAFLTFMGFYPVGDDYVYSKEALLWSRGHFEIFGNQWGTRLVHILPIAISIRLLGLSNFSVALPNIIFTLLSAAALFVLARKKAGSETAFLSSAVFLLIPIVIRSSTSLFTDVPAMFFFLLFIISLDNLFDPAKSRLKSAFVSSLAFLLAYNAQGVVLISVPFIFAAYFLHFREKKDKAIFKKLPWLAVVVVFALLAESLVFFALTGNAFFKYDSISKNHFENYPLAGKGLLEILLGPATAGFKLTKLLFADSFILEPVSVVFANIFLGIIGLFALFNLFRLKKSKNAFEKISAILLWGSLAYLMYGSLHPTDYSPLRRLPRYFLFLAPFFAFQAAGWLKSLEAKKALAGIAIVFFISAASLLAEGSAFGGWVENVSMIYEKYGGEKICIIEPLEGSYLELTFDFVSSFNPKNVQYFLGNLSEGDRTCKYVLKAAYSSEGCLAYYKNRQRLSNYFFEIDRFPDFCLMENKSSKQG